MRSDRIVAWFSCGVASAVACKLALTENQNVEVVYEKVAEEHTDNERFLTDCEIWFGSKITVIGRKDLGYSIYRVFEEEKYIAGIHGASCTRVLKREIGDKFVGADDVMVLGYTVEEESRLNRFIDANPEKRVWTPLIDRGLTKSDCKAIIERAGIQLPMMYRLGYRNNNCVGCVKGGMAYWAKIREDFPQEFDRMNRYTRKVGVRLLKDRRSEKTKRIFLDEIPESIKPLDDSGDVECSIFCHMVERDLALDALGERDRKE